MREWSITSWHEASYKQAADYTDQNALNNVMAELCLNPPLVSSGEINLLKQAIACAGRGEAFILQGGDCAESFKDCRADIISNKLKILLQMSLVLVHGLKMPIIRIGRIAGQYVKPRSSNLETIKGVSLPSYRGDLINNAEFSAAARTHKPELLLTGYQHFVDEL